jgi:hypothetical protein
MSPVADNPVIVPDREQKLGASEPPRVSALRSAVGRLAKKTNGSAPADMSGTRSIREASAQHVFTSGLRRSASHAADGRRIRIGMRLREK